MSEERSPMEREADNRAHRLARAAAVAYMDRRRAERLDMHAYDELLKALTAYEEIAQRQIEEATR